MGHCFKVACIIQLMRPIAGIVEIHCPDSNKYFDSITSSISIAIGIIVLKLFSVILEKNKGV